MFCPNCKSEYRSGFSVCSDCNVALVEKRPDDPNSAERHEDDEAVEPVVFVATDVVEAEAVKGLLEAAGIEVYIADEISPFPGAIGGLKLSVSVEQEELARQILEDYRAHPLEESEAEGASGA